MEKDRSRGLKHIKDKRKYKGNSIKNPKHVPPKSKPSLDSNWDRYESAENEYEHNLSSSTDFALLSNAPISAGSHFQFKSDKISEEHDQEENTLFSLNLDLLNKSISTIPFYERLGIGKEYFQDHEIKHMDENAVKCLLSYQRFIKNHHIMHISPRINLETKPGGVLPVHDTSITQELEHVIEKIENVNCDEKDNVFHLIENCLIEDHTDVKPSVDLEPNDDLEQWLDDILED